jgi:hypothetical protein
VTQRKRNKIGERFVKTAPQPADERQAGNSVNIHIVELVLHGFAPGDRHRISAAVESELARLMGEGGLSGLRGQSLTLGQINAGAFQIKAGAKPQAAGTDIARAVFRSMQQGTRAAARAQRARPGAQAVR